jgi:hypothetical protein
MRNKLVILFLLGLMLMAVSCKTKEVPGRVRAPRHCNTCTKWSFTPQENPENTLLLSDEA